MDGLEKLDRVSYIRFASVYREFENIETFRKEIDTLLSEKNNTSIYTFKISKRSRFPIYIIDPHFCRLVYINIFYIRVTQNIH